MPLHLAGQVVDLAVVRNFLDAESLTNPRLRDKAGDIRLVPLADRVSGEGASWIMAPFTHPPKDGRGGRFNRDFGVWYCAAEEAVAIAESAFHRQRFLRESRILAVSALCGGGAGG